MRSTFRLEHLAIVGLNDLGQDRVVPLERGRHGRPIALPALGRALDVGEDKGRGAGW